MKFILKQWYIHKMYGWKWERLDNFEEVFNNFEIVSFGESKADKIVGYLLAYTDNALKVVFIDYKGTIKTRYIPIAAVAVVDDSASTLTQCLLYKKLNRRDQKDKSKLLVKELLKQAPTWYNGYDLNPERYN